jgi:transcriptional regulator with XRE-family HTH domain
MGKQIRIIRKQRNLGLNALADKIGVSRGYLSNLETGKTNTISLDVLDRIQVELQLYPVGNMSLSKNLELNNRLHRLTLLLKKINETDPQLADYLIACAESGANLSLSK